MILLFRNIIFCILIFVITLFYGIMALFLMHSYRLSQIAALIWCKAIFVLSKHITGVTYKVHNKKMTALRGVIIASNHCSAWETFFLAYYFGIPVFILKRSLFHIPLIGLFVRKLGMIGIDRHSFSKKHQVAIMKRTNEELARNRNIVIFPQGTRVSIEDTYNYEKYPYKSGIALFAPGHRVLTASTDARKFFGKSLFSLKKPGVIQIVFNEKIDFSQDATKEEIVTKIRNSIEEGCKTLKI